MEYNEVMGARLTVLESRISAVEQQLFALMEGRAVPSRKKRELTPEERAAIRARLVAGQEKKRKEREAQMTAEATAQTKKARNGKKGEVANEGQH